MKKIELLVGLLLSFGVGIGTLTAAGNEKTLSISVNKASDDFEEYISPVSGQTQEEPVGNMDFGSTDLELGCENADNVNPQMIGVRFENVAVEKGRKISSAYIEFELDDNAKTTNPFEQTIYAEDNDNPQTFDITDGVTKVLTGRKKLSSTVKWSLGASAFNTVDEKGRTSDISTLVQALVDRDGWKKGNAMAFYFTGTGTREVESYEGEAAAAAKLVITYEMDAEEQKVEQAVEAELVKIDNLTESDYTIPSWTMLLRAKTALANERTQETVDNAEEAIKTLSGKNAPYTIAVSINGNPKTEMGFAWYTNKGASNGRVEVSESGDFTTPDAKAEAETLDFTTPYTNSRNGLASLAGIANGVAKSYTSHKAKVSGLKPGTTYKFRVGDDGAWSETGEFTTDASGKEDFSFMYLTDTQASNDDYYSYTQRTMKTMSENKGDARFCLMAGDIAESSGSANSEWEYEQWFECAPEVWREMPVQPVCGNHDKSTNQNMTRHFNTEKVDFDQKMSMVPGFVYSYVYGNALFIAMSTEDYNNDEYLDNLKQYVTDQVNKYKDQVKWKFVFFHKTMYTGSRSHQNDADGKKVRELFVPVLGDLGIDIAFQGHDHIYEVIGPVGSDMKLVEDAVKDVEAEGAGGVRENMTGKRGGTFNTEKGVLYFLNNSAGKKKYEPRTEAEMEAAFNATGVENYWNMFTGKFGQTGEPTFSKVNVSDDNVTVTTYTVDLEGKANEFDSFKVVKGENGATIVNEIDKNITDDKTYNILGCEVGDWYKGIVVKNGETILRK